MGPYRVKDIQPDKPSQLPKWKYLASNNPKKQRNDLVKLPYSEIRRVLRVSDSPIRVVDDTRTIKGLEENRFSGEEIRWTEVPFYRTLFRLLKEVGGGCSQDDGMCHVPKRLVENPELFKAMYTEQFRRVYPNLKPRI